MEISPIEDLANHGTRQRQDILGAASTTGTRLCKLFLLDFISRGNRNILNVSSTAATTPGPLQVEYYTTKAYVTSWLDELWRDLHGTKVMATSLIREAKLTRFVNARGLSDRAVH